MRSGLTLLIFLILFLLPSVISAQNLFQIALPATAIIVVTILAILYMAAKVLSLPQLDSWVRLEIREVVVAAILIVAVETIFFAEKNVTQILTGNEGYIDVARSHLDGILQIHKTAFNSMIMAGSKITALAGHSYNMPIPAWFFSFSYGITPSAGFSALLSPITVAAQGAANAMFIYKTMAVVLEFFNAVIPTVILPLGFILRIIPFSRQLGNTLIALAIGAFVMYPFSIIIVMTAHTLPGFAFPEPKLTSREIAQLSVKIPFPMKEMCENEFARGFTLFNEVGWGITLATLFSIPCVVGYAACWSAWYPIIAYIYYPLVTTAFQVTMGYEIITGDKDNQRDPGDLFDIVHGFLKDVNNLIVISYVDVLLVAIITVVGTKSISSAIGGESYLMGVQRLI